MNEHTHTESHVDQRTLDLLNRSLDGELSTAEQAELDELLAGSAELRVMNEELKALAGILDGAPEREPPEFLHNVIMSRVTASQGRPDLAESPKSSKPGLFSGWLSAPWARTGLAVAAGLVLTLGIYRTGSENLSPEDATSMTGTIVKDMNGTLLDSTRFDTKLMNGKAELRHKSGFLLIDVYLEANGMAVVNLGFSGQGLEYAGINGLQGQAGDVVAANGSVSVNSSGQQHYELLLKHTAEFQKGSPTPLALEFFADDVLVHEAELGGSR